MFCFDAIRGIGGYYVEEGERGERRAAACGCLMSALRDSQLVRVWPVLALLGRSKGRPGMSWQAECIRSASVVGSRVRGESRIGINEEIVAATSSRRRGARLQCAHPAGRRWYIRVGFRIGSRIEGEFS